MGLIPDRYRFGPKERGKPRVVRRIWCGGTAMKPCQTCIAEEVGDGEMVNGVLKLKTGYEWYSITKDWLWIPGKWWGNTVQCPRCGALQRLPIDKPLVEGTGVNGGNENKVKETIAQG